MTGHTDELASHEAADVNASRAPDATALPSSTRAARKRNRLEARLLIVLTTLAVIYTLAIAESLLVPIALAFLLSLVLAPLVRLLGRFYIPRAAAAGLIIVALLGGLGYGISTSMTPISEWFENAPRVLRQIERKISPIKKTVQEVNKTTEQVDRMTSVDASPTVEVKRIGFRDVLYANAQGLVTGLLMTTLLLYFFLSWGRIMMTRFSRLLDDRKPRHKFIELTNILEIEISKYLLTITLINIVLGVVVAATLYALDMPNPFLWGAVAGVLNYIPYLGALVTAVLLGATALLTFDTLTQPALVVLAFTGLTILEGQILTPLVLGQRLALNPLAVFLSVVFWFWLWGVVGAFMAVPTLITLKLIGDRVEALRPVSVMAGR